MCLADNRNETFSLFSLMRREFDRGLRSKADFVTRRADGTRPRIRGYLDLSQLSAISTASAVIMAAEYERMRILQGVVPPTVDLHKWNDNVFIKLFQLGFFEITGHAPVNNERLIESDRALSMRIVRSTAANDLQEIDYALQRLFQFLGVTDTVTEPIIIEFLTALSEAMTNVTNHAYADDYEFEQPHVNSFWVAATANRERKNITIVVYDQGATIPATYPRLERLQKIKRFLSRALNATPDHRYDNDGTYIRAAMRYGGSRTDQVHRGRGFPQMFTILQKIGKGTLTVYSRGGWCRRTSEGRMKSGAVEAAIGGTLVEWTVAIP